MANDTNNIYIESSFFDHTYTSEEDISVEFFNDEPDNIGDKNLVTQFTRIATSAVARDLIVEYTYSPSVSGTDQVIVVAYYHKDGYESGNLSSLVEYSSGAASISGSKDIDVAYFVKDTATSGSQYVNVAAIMGDKMTYFDAIPLHYWIFTPESGTVSITTNYTNYSGQHDSGMNPIGWLEFGRDVITTYFSEKTMISGGFSKADVDITFAGWVPGATPFDVFSSSESKPFINVDFPTASGKFTGIGADVFSSVSGTTSFLADLFCCLTEMSTFDSDVSVISGSCDAFALDIWAGTYSSIGIEVDVSLFSMYFDNFSIAEGEYMPASGTLCVDVHDETYNVVTSGTYFLVDGVQVSGTLTPIYDGYTLCYNPLDDFSSLEGPTTFTIHAENDNGDVLEQDFYVTFGYIVEYDYLDRVGLGYGYSTKVGVRMTAENMTQCPVTSADGYWFETEQRKNVDLGASIVGIPDTVNVDLGASIYPQSTAFFYDKVFRMVLNARDYEGNEMEPFILEFKIENPNS